MGDGNRESTPEPLFYSIMLVVRALSHLSTHQQQLDVHFKLCFITGALVIRRSDDVVVQWLSVVGLFIDDVFGGGTGHPWNVRQTSGGSLGHRGPATLQQELSVVDDPGAARGCAEQCSSGCSGVVMRHVLRVVYGHPSGRRDGLGSGLLTTRGHLRLL